MHNILDDIINKQSKAHRPLPFPQCELYFTVCMLSHFKLYSPAWQLYA